jgi:hypothetical protein
MYNVLKFDLIVTLFFEKNANFFCRKLSKIAENCDHNIDSRLCQSIFLKPRWKAKLGSFGFPFILTSLFRRAVAYPQLTCQKYFRKMSLHFRYLYFIVIPTRDRHYDFFLNRAKNLAINCRFLLEILQFFSNIG